LELQNHETNLNHPN